MLNSSVIAVSSSAPSLAPGVVRMTGFTPGHPPAIHEEAPIGLYDSGVGGLTVLAAIARRLPNERFVYIADQAHVPYGGRPLGEIRTFAGSLARYLFDRGCKMAVMACNISSATALEDVEAGVGPEHVLGVIHPGARAAVARTRAGRIGVLATAGTVASGAYPRSVATLDAGLEVHQVACPRFVPLVEAGETETPDAEDAAATYLAPLRAAGVDTVILGCTHYPFLLPTLRTVAPELAFVDPAEATAAAVEDHLVRAGRVRGPHPGHHELLTTGAADTFATQLSSFMPGVEGEIAHLPWAP